MICPPEDAHGLMNLEINGCKVTDIEPAAAFDINNYKVDKDLSEAMFARPNMQFILHISR